MRDYVSDDHIESIEEIAKSQSAIIQALSLENSKLRNQLQQKENIIKEVRGDLDKQIDFCTNEANGTTNDKYCRIAIQYLKHLKQKLDKENRL